MLFYSSLKKIAQAYNKEHKRKISIPKKINKQTRKELWNDIQDAMKAYTNCNEDYCLLDSHIVKDINDPDIKFNTFRPEMPESWNSNMNTWLSTIDIAKVMKQYEHKYNDFNL